MKLSLKKTIIFTNINKVIPPKKNLEIRVRWQVKEGENGTPVVQSCSNFSSRVKATDNGTTKTEQETGCGYKVSDIEGTPDATQTQIIFEGFKEIKKETNDSDPNNVVITFTNEKVIEPKRDLEIAVKWQLKDAVTGNITLLSCSQYQTNVNTTMASISMDKRITNCGFIISDIEGSGNLDATQSIISEGFTQISKTGPTINGTTTTITFVNEKVVESDKKLIINVKWRTKVGENGTPVEQPCSRYQTIVRATDSGSTKVEEKTDCGFTVEGIKGDPDASQTRIISEGFVQVDKIGPTTNGDTTTITFINEKVLESEIEIDKEREVEVIVKWHEKDTTTDIRTQLQCGDFVTHATIKSDGVNSTSQDTCSGFKEVKKTPGTDIVVFENEREVTPDNSAEIIVEWYEENSSGNKTQLQCGEYKTDVEVSGSSSSQETCSGFNTEIPKNSFNASQSIKTPEFFEFEKNS